VRFYLDHLICDGEQGGVEFRDIGAECIRATAFVQKMMLKSNTTGV
jgi:hypothetical protein